MFETQIPIEGKDFIIHLEIDETINRSIEILTGKYAGTIYRYGQHQIDQVDDKTARINFQFEIVKSNRKNLNRRGEFIQHIGNILNTIILNNYEKDGKFIPIGDKK